MPNVLTVMNRPVHAPGTTGTPHGWRVARCEAWRYRIPLRRPFGGARGALSVREGLVVRLTSGAGATGIGEGVAHPFASAAALGEAWEELCAWQQALSGGDDVPVQCVEGRHLPGSGGSESWWGLRSPLVRAAVETAARDLQARERGLPLAATLAAAPRASVPVNATVGTGDPAAVVAAVAARVAQGFGCVKLKLDPERFERHVETLRLVRQAVGSGPRLRLDANAAWTVDAAIAALRRIAEFDIEYVEQPVASIAGLARVRRAAGVRIAADESVVSAAAVRALAAARAVDVVVVKPALCGIAEALRIADEADRLGLEVVVTSLLESSVGVLAALHVAAAVPGPLGACGLATAELLSGDLVQSVVPVDRGAMHLPDGPGLGVELDPVAVKRWAVGASEVRTPATNEPPDRGGAE